MELSLIFIIGGALVLLWLYLWVRQRQQLGSLPTMEAAMLNGAPAGANDAVIVASASGQVLYINEIARRMFQLDNVDVDLESLAGVTHPPESFFELFAASGQSAFQIANNWIEGSSHQIPSDTGTRTVVVLRDMSGAAAVSSDAIDLVKAVQIVSEVGETVNAGLGIEQTLQALLTIVRKALPADAGEICLWDEETRILEPRGWVGDAQYVLQLAESGGSYGEDEGISGWIARQRRPVLVTDRDAPDAVRPKLDDSVYRSFIGVPLLLNERFIGTFELASIQPGTFTGAHMALLQAVAKPIATAIYNAEIYADQQRRIQDLASLQEVTYDPEDAESISAAYATITERVARLLGAEMCGILLYDERKNVVLAQTPFHGLPAAVARGYTIPAHADSPGYNILNNAEYWISNDLSDEPQLEELGMDLLVNAAGVRNTTLVPLVVGSRRIGLAQINNKKGQSGFALRDVQNLRLLAAQIAIIVEDIRLAQEEQRREAEMSGMQEITQALGAITHEREFFASANERIARLMEVQYCGILLYDDSRRCLRAQPPFYGLPDEVIAEYQIDLAEGSPMELIWENEPSWFTNNAPTDKVVIGAGLAELASALGVSKTLLAIMEVGGRKVGVVQVSNKLNGEDFTDKEARLLAIFGAQIASLIENSRLFREAQRRADEAEELRLVAELSGQILSSDDSFLPSLAAAARLLRCEAVFLNVLDRANGTLTTAPQYVYGRKLAEPLVQNIYTKDFEHTVAISRQPFISNDLAQETNLLAPYRFAAQHLNIQQLIMVPLVVGDQTFGEMGAINSQDDGFTEEDLRVLSAIAIQAAAALDRIRLYETTGQNLSRRLQELDAISRVSNELAQTLDFERLLDVARLEAVRATDADGNTIALLKPSSEWRDPLIPELQSRLGEPLEGLSALEIAAVQARGEAIIVEDYADSPYAPTPANARSALAASFLYEDQTVGVIHLYHHQPHHFDQRAATFLLTLASKASLSYGNNLRFLENQDRSNRLRRRVEQLNQIFELGQMLQTNVSPVTMLEAIAYSVQQSCGFDAVIMTLAQENSAEGEDKTFYRLAQAGVPVESFEASKSATLSMKAFETLIAKDEYRISESYFLPFEKLQSWYVEGLETFSAQFEGQRTLHPHGKEDWRDGDMLIVPIRGVTGEVLGAMSLDRPFDGKRPDRGTIEVLEIFAHQAASTIENNRLYTASLRSAEQEARLNEVMEAIASTLDLSQIVEGVAQGVIRLIPIQRMTLALLDSEQQGFDTVNVTIGLDNSIVIGRDRRPTLDGTALGRTFMDGHDYLYHAGENEDEAYQDLQSWQAQGEHTSLIVPLITGGLVLGAMHIGSNLVNAFGFEEYRPLIRRIANLTAVAVQNARLFSQAVNLRLFNESIFQSIQQGLIVLDRAGTVLTVNDFIRRRYHFGDDSAGRVLFDYRPEFAPILREAFEAVIEQAQPRELLNVRMPVSTTNVAGGAAKTEALTQNFFIYPLLSNDMARGAVVLVDDVTERARLEQDIAARSSQLEALTEVSSRITAALQRDEVIALALDEMQRVIGYDAIAVWEREDDEFVLEAARGFDMPIEPLRVPIDDSRRLRSLVEQQRMLAASPDAYDSLPGLSMTRSWLGVPLVRQNNVIGMITLASNQRDFYDVQAEQAAVAFANQVAVALSNADLFEEASARTQRLSLLNRVSMSLAQSLDIENILEISLREIANALGVENARAYLFERDTNLARVMVEMPRGDEPPEIAIEVEKAKLLERVWRKPQALIIEDANSVEDAEIELELLKKGVAAYLLIPMTVGGQSNGAYELEVYDSPREFDAEKVDLALIIASQAAIAILNANLLEQTMVRTRELETLLEAVQSTSTTLDLDEVFEGVVRLTMQALDVDDCCVMIYDNVEEILTVMRDGNRNGDERRISPPGTEIDLYQYPAKTRALRDAQIIVVRSDDPNADKRELAEMSKSGDTCRMLVPLVAGDAVIGMLQVDLQTPYRTFTHRDVRMAQALGAQAATAIENARLSTETSAQVAQSLMINELSRAISSTMDVRQMINIIRDQVPDLTSASELYLALYDSATDEITFPLAVREGKAFEIPPRLLGSDEVSYVIRNRRLLMLGGENPPASEMRRNMGIVENEDGATRYLGVPLAAGDQVVGVLAVRDHGATRPFGLNDQRIMTTIGAQLGAMIQNSNLFARVQNFASELNVRVEERTVELQQERDRLDALYQITSELGRTLDMSRVLDGALHMVSETINAEEGIVLLIDPMSEDLYARAIRHPNGRVELDEGFDALASADAEGTDTSAVQAIGAGYNERKRHPAVMVGNWILTQEERAALIPELDELPFWNDKAEGAGNWHSALAVALEIEGEAQGALVFFSSQANAFTDPQLRLVAAAANQVSSAIKNADLYSLIRDQATRMQTMLQTEREEAEKNSAILEGIADGVLLADSSGVIVLFNSAAERILELPRDYAIGQPLTRIRGLYGGEAPWVAALSEYVMNPPLGNSDVTGEDFVVDRLDIGKRIINIRSSPVYNGDQFLGTVSLFRDMTKDVEVDRMKSEFISNVSHELRTPMTSIKGYADLLLMGAGGQVTAEQERFLQTIKVNADRLAELVNDLLNISKIDAGSEQLNIGRVNMGELVEQTIAYISGRVEFQRKGIHIKTTIEPDLPPIAADRIKVTQIIGNIVDNAFAYTYPNGHIDVSVRYDRAKDGVLVTVRDDGIGIPEAFKDRIWNRFERYDEHALVLEVAGTGLGLSIVKHLVELHKGTVWFESEEGKGSVFYVLLPVGGPDGSGIPVKQSLETIEIASGD